MSFKTTTVLAAAFLFSLPVLAQDEEPERAGALMPGEGGIPSTMMARAQNNVTPAYPDGNLQDDLSTEQWLAQGEEFYNQPGACVTCHLADASGDPQLNAKSLQFGPTPSDIYNAINGVPAMGFIKDAYDITKGDMLALSLYIRQISNLEIKDEETPILKQTLAGLITVDRAAGFVEGEKDKTIREIGSFKHTVDNWVRRSQEGPIGKTYQTTVVQEWDPGEPKFTPEPGKTYFYQNVGDSNFFGQATSMKADRRMRVVVGDAETHEVIAYNAIDEKLRGSIHTTVMSPDGKHGYIIGAAPFVDATELFAGGGLDSPATLIKYDALSLEPVKQIIIGGRIHHGQIYQDRYLLIDTFQRNEDGLDVFLYDPETDEVIGGVRDEELGGSTYTAFTDNEFIYILMEPAGWGPISQSGFTAGNNFTSGNMTALPSFWIAKIDPETWEVVAEIPYPGYRADWICFDGDMKYMYVPQGATSQVSKINMKTNKVVWTVSTGTGPYGCNLNADNSELWVTNKGEMTGFFGRTVSVLDTQAGRGLDTVFSGYMIDHILLSPNGKEFWGTSNAEGLLYVFDADKRVLKTTIEMPGFGDAHGLPFVYYDEDGNSMVVKDQGLFHNGVDPRNGKALEYSSEPAPAEEAVEEAEEPEEKGFFERLFGSL